MKYLRQSNFVGATTDAIPDAFKLRADMRELLLALDSVTLPLGRDITVFRHVHYKAFEHDIERQKRCKEKKIVEAKAKLEEGLEEWLAIECHWITLSEFSKYQDNELWQRVLQSAAKKSDIGKHIALLRKHIVIADELLADVA